MSKNIELMCHLVAGYPNWELFADLCVCLEESGADYLEIQLPFTDPMADGPVIMQANASVLNNNYQLEEALNQLESIIKKINIPVYVMSYMNIFYSQGGKKLSSELKKIGVSGCIIPDLSYEANQKEKLKEKLEQESLNFVAVLAPNQSEMRLKKIKPFCSDILYLPTRTGVTGNRTNLQTDLFKHIDRTRQILKPKKIALGFGLSSHEQIVAIQGRVDIAVVGTAILENINMNLQNPLNSVAAFIKQLLVGSKKF